MFRLQQAPRGISLVQLEHAAQDGVERPLILEFFHDGSEFTQIHTGYLYNGEIGGGVVGDGQ